MKSKEDRAAELCALYWAVNDYMDANDLGRLEAVNDLLIHLQASWTDLGQSMTMTERCATDLGGRRP